MSNTSKAFRLWEQVPILRLLLPFIVGILLFDTAPVLLSDNFVFVLPVLIFSNLTLLAFSLNKPKFAFANATSTVVLLATIAYSICYFNDDRHNNQWFGHNKNTDSSNSLVLVTKAEEKGKTYKYEVELLHSISEKSIRPCEGKAFVYVYKNVEGEIINKGDILLLPSDWSAITNSGNPFEMDYKKFCGRKNFFYQQFLSPKQVIIYARNNKKSISIWDKAHGYCISSINAFIKDSTSNALLKAMIIGEEKDIDPNTREAYSDTGIIHIVSISGAHVAIIFAAVYFLFGLIKTKKYKWVKVIASLAIIWFYVMLAGASTPALRAAAMFSILAIGNVSNQRANPLNQLFSTAFILLLIQPMWLFSIGFQLSFMAVLSLIIFYPSFTSLFKPSNKIVLFFSNAIAASIAAEILVAPLVAYYFHSFPIMFIFANVLASLTMGAILVLGMLMILFAKISVIATFLSTIIVFISNIFHKGIYLLQQVNFNAFKTIYLPALSMLFLYLLIASLVVTIGFKKKRAVWASLCCLLTLSIFHLQRSLQINSQEQLIVFNKSREAYCEYIDANWYSIIKGSDEENRATKNVHIGLGVKKKEMPTVRQLYVINDQKVLLMDSNTKADATFPVDVLIVTSVLKNVDVPALAKAFSPGRIVIANNQNKFLADRWKSQCREAQIAFHNTKTDGAFIIQ